MLCVKNIRTSVGNRGRSYLFYFAQETYSSSISSWAVVVLAGAIISRIVDTHSLHISIHSWHAFIHAVHASVHCSHAFSQRSHASLHSAHAFSHCLQLISQLSHDLVQSLQLSVHRSHELVHSAQACVQSVQTSIFS